MAFERVNSICGDADVTPTATAAVVAEVVPPAPAAEAVEADTQHLQNERWVRRAPITNTSNRRAATARRCLRIHWSR